MTTNLGPPLKVFLRNVKSLILREMRTRFGGHQIGYLWALLEPLGAVLMLSIIFSTGLRGREPSVGDSWILFFAAGLLPYNTYRACTQAINKTLRGSRSLLFFPIIKPIDTYIAPIILETLTLFIVMNTVFFVYFAMYGSGLPDSIVMMTLPFLYLAVMGFSLGIINATISLYFKAWMKFWKVINKPMFFISGILYTAETLPAPIQNILYYNPVLHCVEWARSGYFKGWYSGFLDLQFLNTVVIALLFTALMLERSFRRQISQA